MTWTTRPRSKRDGIAYVVAGQGPHVLFLHGVGLRAEAWGAQIDALVAAGFRVMAPDMLGHGETPFAPAQSIAEYAAPLAAFLETQTVIVGHSMGAMMAVELASSYAQNVRGVAALNAIYQRDAAAKAAVQSRVAALDGVTQSDPEGTLSRWFGTAASEARAACGSWLRDVDPASYKAAYSVFAASDGPTPAQLENLNCAALFATGGDEPNSTPRMSQAMASLTPKGRAVVVPDAAHMMPMTDAAFVNQTLRTFVEECFA